MLFLHKDLRKTFVTGLNFRKSFSCPIYPDIYLKNNRILVTHPIFSLLWLLEYSANFIALSNYSGKLFCLFFCVVTFLLF